MSDQREAIIEALLLGANRMLASESVGVDERTLYTWLNAGIKEPDGELGEWRARFVVAEAKGKEHRDRTERMRVIVEGHDEAYGILLKRQSRYREQRAALAKGNQLSLIDP